MDSTAPPTPLLRAARSFVLLVCSALLVWSAWDTSPPALAAPRADEANNTISGVVRDTDNNALDNIFVALKHFSDGIEEWETLYVEYTNELGEYTFDFLEDDAYRVEFVDTSGVYFSQYYDGDNDGEPDAIVLEGNTDRDDINANLVKGGSISGRVTEGENGLAQITVFAQRQVYNDEDPETPLWEPGPADLTDEDGNYTLSPLEAGLYTLQFIDYQNGLYLTQSLAVPISVALGQEVEVDNVVMQVGGRISGRVTDGVNGLAQITVFAQRQVDNDEDPENPRWEPGPADLTDEDGNYTLSPLEAGLYTLQFIDSQNGLYLTQSLAVPISVALGQEVEVDNVVMQVGGRISGRVTDGVNGLAQITVFAQRQVDNDEDPENPLWESVPALWTNPDGTYSISPLEAGLYSVQFIDSEYGLYLGQTLNNLIPVILGQDSGGNDVVMQIGGRISGRVTDPDEEGWTEVTIVIYRLDEDSFEYTWYTPASSDPEGPDGAYLSPPLAPGSYKVEFTPFHTYSRQYYDGKASLDAADPILVYAGQTTSGIDAQLTVGNQIAGVVRDTKNETLPGIWVTLYDPEYSYLAIQVTQTDEHGAYSFLSVEPGSYRVKFGGNDQPYLVQFYDGVPTFDEAEILTIPSDPPLTNINAVMQEGGSISGQVTDGVNGLSGASITLYRQMGQDENLYWEYADMHPNVGDGTYAFNGLAPGVYTLGFTGPGDAYIPQYYNGKTDLPEADEIPLTFGQVETINVTLASYPARISGTVTAQVSGDPLEGIEVRIEPVEWYYGGYPLTAYTDANGDYSFVQTPAGSYRVSFTDPNRIYVSQYYPGVFDPVEDSWITLPVEDGLEGVDAEMVVGGRISGQVTDGNGGLQNVSVTLHRKVTDAENNVSWALSRSDVTDEAGNYSIGALRPGAYIVYFSPGGLYLPQYYTGVLGGSPDQDGADELQIGLGDLETGIDAVLQAGGRIVGYLSDPNNQPVMWGAVITVYRLDDQNNWQPYSYASLDYWVGGDFQTPVLPPGEYTLGFAPGGESPLPFVPQFYDNKPSLAEANSIPVGSNDIVDIETVQLAAINPATFCDSVTQIPASECNALVAFYQQTNGPSWWQKGGWLILPTPCSWYGVSCTFDDDTGVHHVVSLSLFSNNLHGTLSAALGDLTRLTNLNLDFNNLSGSIPPVLGNLTSLEFLFLNNNALSGSIPPELGSLTDLTMLSLDANQLSGSIPAALGNLDSLTHLILNQNQLSGAIPAELGNLGSLNYLQLHTNQLSGAVPATLGTLANLVLLHLSDNAGLTGPLPASLPSLPSLSLLYYSGTALCAPGDSAFTTWLGSLVTHAGTGVTCSAGDPLSALALSQGALAPAFAPQTTAYTAQVPAATGNISVTATTGQQGATLQINGAAAQSGQPFGPIALAVGANPVNVVVTGQSTITYTILITRAPFTSAIALQAAPSPSLFGQNVTLNATVTSPGGTPTGNVEFYRNGVLLSTVTLNNGSASLPVAGLAAGGHTFSAVYTGSATVTGSTSSNVAHTVNPAATTTTLGATPNPAVFGQGVTLTATVAAAAGTPTGNVEFYRGATLLGTVALNNGSAFFNATGWSAGAAALQARYLGTATHAPSESSAVSHTVQKLATTVTLTSSAALINQGQPLTLTAVVTTGSALIPTGTVAFMTPNDQVLGTAGLQNGQATLVTQSLPRGTHPLTAVYQEEANFATSTSGVYTQTVNGLPVAVNDGYSLQQGESRVLDVLANDSDPDGDPLTLLSITQPVRGSAVLQADQTILYQAPEDYTGGDSFKVTIGDGRGGLATGTVAIVIYAQAAPVVIPLDLDIQEPVTLTVGGSFETALVVPPGLLGSNLQPGDTFFLAMTEVVTPTETVEQTPAPNFKFGNVYFQLTAFVNDTGLADVQFDEPLILTLTYPPGSIEDPETEVPALMYWDEETQQWSGDGIELLEHDVEARRITVAISHLTEFALFIVEVTPDDEVPTSEQILFLPQLNR